MRKKDKPPSPIVRKEARGLAPVAAFDAEELAGFAVGTEFDLVPRTKRSIPQNGTYWKALQVAVDATGRWQSREALHTALKVKLGYVEPIFNLQGQVIGMKPDSTAFEAMTHKEFRAFMDRALGELSEAVGFDVLEWMHEGAA
jgi:hypothetical protein